ncbi:hypothetical protein [Spirosoma pollinicola]|uniref:hypothetical protein n=1 Tax=Spirosoma pollinicola TaxID=2057025 RepID=UPI0012FD249B|nr:hypothetical protein [Spirosoma pollinicola]
MRYWLVIGLKSGHAFIVAIECAVVHRLGLLKLQTQEIDPSASASQPAFSFFFLSHPG